MRHTLPDVTRRSRARSPERARAFAVMYFGGCAIHQAEAAAVQDALERLAGRPLSLTPEVTVREVLLTTSAAPSLVWEAGAEPDSLDRIELAMALEQELASGAPVDERAVLEDVRGQAVLETLLGTAAQASTWEPATIWMRSLGGVINKRVRHRRGCTCA